jgi:hypothetical protein
MNSPSKKIKWDLRLERHGSSVCLIVPLTEPGLRWVERCIGADNGFQPFYPTVVIEPRYLDEVITGMRRRGLVMKSGGERCNQAV